MGLDVYLEHCKNLERAIKLETECEKLEEEIWSQYPSSDEMTDEQKDEARQKVFELRDELGI